MISPAALSNGDDTTNTEDTSDSKVVTAIDGTCSAATKPLANDTITCVHSPLKRVDSMPNIPEGKAGNANEAVNLVVTLTSDAAKEGNIGVLLLLLTLCLTSIQ